MAEREKPARREVEMSAEERERKGPGCNPYGGLRGNSLCQGITKELRTQWCDIQY